MSRRVIPLFIVLAILSYGFYYQNSKPYELDPKSSLADFLRKQGLKNFKFERNDSLVRHGEELIKKGFTTLPNGKKSSIQSIHFKCTHCHNLEIEDPQLFESNPETRLEYAVKHNLPFLPGTTLKGVVNRETWYNGDYEKKYGALVKKARNSLEGAIQLCATECSQGREFTEWELQAVKAYLWSLEYTIQDLNLQPRDYDYLLSKASAEEKVSFIKSKYLLASPATFARHPRNLKKGYGLKGNVKRGEQIYELSCLHCHNPQNGITYLDLDKTKMTFEFLRKNISKHSDLSLYEAIREGVSGKPGERAYMPNFTLERMSNQQIEDLRAYIEYQD